MRCKIILACSALLGSFSYLWAYVEAPHTLGRCCAESTHVVLLEVTKVNKEKGLILFKKVQDLKGKHNEQEIKHNIGQRGFHAREWQNIMKWAETGKKAVFFHNGGASETCIDGYWYQCYKEGDWWGLSHAEPFLLRTFFGSPEKLAAAVEKIQKNQEVIVPCLADGSKEQLHLRKGKMQRLKASLKRMEYDAKRDFVGWGGDSDDDVIAEFKTVILLAQSTAGWKFLAAAQLKSAWRSPDFDDSAWRTGKAPIGYGEPEIAKRTGTTIREQGQPFVFRRSFEMPADLLNQKGVTFRVMVASDDNAEVYLNGELIDRDAEADHEFAYWNREVELQPKHLKAGKNLLAAVVKNKQASSDLYFDLEVEAQIPIPKPVKKPVLVVAKKPAPEAKPIPIKLPASGADKPGFAPVVDKQKRTVTLACTIAPRKLPNLDQIYPIEVIATYPAPDGQKAHETVVNIAGFKPSSVHKALETLNLRPGKPALGEGAQAAGPELKISLEFTGPDGKPLRLSLEKALVDRKTGKPLPAVKWHFTGSAMKQPDPEKDDKFYGADLTGTLIALFPVTEDTVIQTSLTMKDEPLLKLETDKASLPKEGTAAKLVIEVK